jgi:short-subunit dehydrogenase
MRHFSLQDRWVVVTGASSGLGRAIAHRLAVEERARVIAVARRKDRLTALADEVAEAGGVVVPLPGDITTAGAPAQIIADAHRLAGEIPFGLVNNAGITWYGRFTEMPVQEIGRIIDLNIRATIELTLAFLLLHGQDGENGSSARAQVAEAAILTVTSLAAHVPVPYQSVYAASKHALQAFVESIAAEVADRGIVASTVEPGGIKTEMIELSGLDGKFSPRALLSADAVAAAAVKNWKRGKLRSVPGLSNRLVVAFGRFLPRRIVARASERLFRP